MLKINEEKKVIEYKGEQIELIEPSAKEQTSFAMGIDKEKDQMKQLDSMIDYICKLGVKKKLASTMSINSLKDIIEYAHGTEKK